MQDGKGVMDPVERAEMEIAELEEAQRQELEAMGIKTEPQPGAEGESADPAEAGQTIAEPTQPAEEPQTQQQTAQKEEDPNSETYQQRWLSLQGTHRSEVRRLKSEIERLQMSLEQLQTQASGVSQQQSTKDNGIAPGEEGFLSGLVTDAMRKTRAYQAMAQKYGTEYAELHYEGIAEAARVSVEPVREEVARVTDTTQQQRLYETERFLTSQVPEWQQLNGDPDFIQWTQNSTAPFSGGRTYNEILNSAYFAGDGVGCSEVFLAYQQLRRQAPAQSQPQPQVTAQVQSPEHLVTPQGSNTSTPASTQPQQSGTPVVNEKYIDNFYRDVEKGMYKGREAEMRNIEIEIFKTLSGAA